MVREREQRVHWRGDLCELQQLKFILTLAWNKGMARQRGFEVAWCARKMLNEGGFMQKSHFKDDEMRNVEILKGKFYKQVKQHF